MQTIINDIKTHTFHRIYLLYGEEAYLKRSYKMQLKNAIVRPDDTMNFHCFEGKGISPKEIIDLAETMPFFSDYRFILIENSGFFKNSCEELAVYVKEIPETCVFLFVEKEVDRRGKFFKAVKQFGHPVELTKQSEKKLIPWIFSILKKEGKKITEANMQLFLTKTGTDMESIANELEKLICYTYSREVITAEDIEAVCCEQITGKIFELISAISEKQQKKALELYYDLLLLKEPPMKILFLLARQFHLLMQVKELSAAHYDFASISKHTGLQSFLIGKYLNQAKHFSSAALFQAIQDCTETEESIKTGQIEDRLGVELLIISYSQANG